MSLNRLTHYLKTRPWHWYLALAITLAAGFLRFYRIPDTVMFLGDQGRDALLVARMFRELDPVFIGPVTSVGNMYLGPFYYYFMLPFLWLSYPSPLGPVYAVAFFSTITVFLTYSLGKKMFSPPAGLIGSFLLAFSAEAINISRFSWNPNLAPLLSLLMIYFSWKAFKKPKNWIVVTLLFSLIIQLHYLALLTGATVLTLWLYYLSSWLQKKTGQKRKNFLLVNAKICAVCLLVFLLSLLPQILFDLKHGGLNVAAFKNIFSQEQILTDQRAQTFTQSVSRFFLQAKSRANHILIRVPVGRLGDSETTITLSLFLLLAYSLYLSGKLKKKPKFFRANLIITAFLLIGIMGTALYQHALFNHYIAYLYPVVVFVYAVALTTLFKINKKLFLPVAVVFLIWFFILNAQRWPLQPNYLYHNTKKTSALVYELLEENETYDLVLLSETRDHYAQSYRWFLSTTDHPPLIKETGETADTLIIIDEEKKVEDATKLDIYDIKLHSDKEIDVQMHNQNLPDIYILRSSSARKTSLNDNLNSNPSSSLSLNSVPGSTLNLATSNSFLVNF